MNFTRDELLQNLYVIQQRVREMVNVYGNYVRLGHQFRAPKDSISLRGTAGIQWALITVQLAIILHIAMECLLYPETEPFILFVVMGFLEWPFFTSYLRTKRTEKPKRKMLALFIMVLISCLLFGWMVRITAVYVGLGKIIFQSAISLGIVIGGIWLFITLKNKSTAQYNQATEEHNQALQAQRASVYAQYEALRKELLRCGGGWYPPGYYSVEAADFFVSAVSNFRANTVQEMVNLFEQTEQQKQMLAYQRQQNEQMQQLVADQKEMQKQMRFANLINIASMFQLQSIGNTVSNAYADVQIQKNYDRFN